MFGKELINNEKLAQMRGCQNNDGFKQPSKWKQYYVYPVTAKTQEQTRRHLEETGRVIVDRSNLRYPAAKLLDSDSEFDQHSTSKLNGAY